MAVQRIVPVPQRVIHPDDQIPHARPRLCVRRRDGHREVLASVSARTRRVVASRPPDMLAVLPGVNVTADVLHAHDVKLC